MTRSIKKLSELQRAQLFVSAGGRCEFPGCGQVVDYHDITREPALFFEAAHIVAASSDGPRGDPVRSDALAADLDNFLLLCRNHHKPIDKMGEGHDYDEEELLRFKERHEDRVRTLLSIDPHERSIVLEVTGTIGGQRTTYAVSEMNSAVVRASDFKRSPARQQPLRVPLDDLGTTDGDPEDHGLNATVIRNRIEREMALVDDDRASISLFALAPMSDLANLGVALGNKRVVHHHVRDRHRGSWEWSDPDAPDDIEYQCDWPQRLSRGAASAGASGIESIAIAFDLSGIFDRSLIARRASGMPLISLTVPKPSRSLVRCEKDIAEFSRVWRELADELCQGLPDLASLHLFPAMPACLSVEVGRQLPVKQLDSVWFYDANKARPDGISLPIRIG